MAVVKLFGGLRRYAGQSRLNISGDTVRAVVQSLCTDNPELRGAIWDGDQLRDHVRVMIDGHAIELGLGLETPVGSDNEIAIFPPIAGGSNIFG